LGDLASARPGGHTMNKQQLINFEKEVVNRYMNREIKSPVHLSGGNEKQLIEIFKEVEPRDWVFTTYRSHYHALLKGVPKKWLMNWIKDNKSIHLMNKEHQIVSSAIVGGTLSQAVGCAMAIKQKNEDKHVWCFCGDMTASLGVFKDCWEYAFSNDLPITFVIEDNGLSTDTPTKEAWGGNWEMDWDDEYEKIRYYKYNRIYPHYGVGKKIDFETGKEI